MKIALVADVHFGVRDRTEDILHSLSAIRKYNQENGIQTWIILGDLFHDRRGVAWDVLDKSYSFFEETKSVFGQEVVSFLGNHDLFMRSSFEFHSMRALRSVLTVIDDIALIEVGGRRFRIIPFIHFEDVYMNVVDNVLKDSSTGRDDIILTHVGVKNASLNECFLIKHWSVVSFENIPHKVYTGHFHCTQKVGDNLWYPGSPLAFNFTEGLVDHGFFVFDTDTGTHEFVSLDSISLEDRKLYPESGRPPKFVTVTDDIIKDPGLVGMLAGNHVRIAVARDYSKPEMVEMRHLLQENGAKNVTTMRLKESEVELETSEKVAMAGSRPENLLKAWFEADKPEHISSELLFELNGKIVEEGNERLAASSTEDE